MESRQEGGSGTTESPPPPGIAPKARSARIEIPDQGSAFLWVLGLSAFSFNLGYGIVIPILEELAHRCGGTVESPDKAVAFTAMAGALMLFNFAKILGEVPGGILSDRVGDRLILGTSLLVYCVSVVLLIGARSYFPFEFARSIEGFATGISYPAMTSILLRHSPQSKLGRNMSIALGVGVFGIIVGPVVANPLKYLSFLPVEPVDRPLYVALAFTIGVFVFSCGWFLRAPAGTKQAELNDEKIEQKIVAADTLLAGGPGPVTSRKEARDRFLRGVAEEFTIIGRFARSPVFLGLLAPLFFDKMMMAAWQVLLFAHAPAVGFDKPDHVGYLMGLLAFSFAIVTPVSGVLADRVNSRVLAHGSLLGIVATLVLFLFAWTQVTFVLVFFAYSVFSAALLTVHLKMIGDLYHEDQQHGRIFGIVHALSDGGMIVGPMLIWLYTLLPPSVGPLVTFVVMAGLGFLSIPAFHFSNRPDVKLPRP